MLMLKPETDYNSAAGEVRSHIYDSICDIGAYAWNSCFPNELEDYHYLLAVEKSGIAGFEWHYATVEQDGVVLAAMPAFITYYNLDTTLDEGGFRRLLRRIRGIWPGFMVVKLACLGSPETECGSIGFHPDVQDSCKQELAAMLLKSFEQHAVAKNCRLLGLKDVPEQQKEIWQQAAPAYAAIPGMATAHLDIDFATIDEYLARLSRESRKDMRRKLRSAENIEIEQRNNIDDVLLKVLALYRETKERSEFQFDELTAGYFSGVLSEMGERAFCTLYWHDGELLAANLMLKDEDMLLDKFFCMTGRGREHNLYFLSWFGNIQYCLQHGIKRYQSGQACYDNKLRLKSSLNNNWMMFRHTNKIVGWLLKTVAPLFAMGE